MSPVPSRPHRTIPRPGVLTALTEARALLVGVSAFGFPPFIRWFDAVLDRPGRIDARATGHRGRA